MNKQRAQLLMPDSSSNTRVFQWHVATLATCCWQSWWECCRLKLQHYGISDIDSDVGVLQPELFDLHVCMGVRTSNDHQAVFRE